MRRRDFIKVIGGTAAVAWPIAARAQQPKMPVIGFLSSLTISDRPRILAPFHQGVNEAGYVEGRDVAIEYRWAEGKYDRLPSLAADLVRRNVTVIAAISGTPSALAAKAATTTIPIVFAIGGDPVAPGLVSGLNRPTGNVTGVTFFAALLMAKRLQILGELVPKTITFAALINPDNPPSVLEGTNLQAAALTTGKQVKLMNARNGGQIDDAFATIVRERISAIFVSADPVFFNERHKVVALAARHSLPTIYADRENVEAGGLISYGASRSAAYRQAGIYVGRILNGNKPADLPVVLPTKFEFVINLKTAKSLGLTVPQTLQVSADEVIE